MPDYKEMYLTMMRATEKAVRILIDAQRECEELYLREPPPLHLSVTEKPSAAQQKARHEK